MMKLRILEMLPGEMYQGWLERMRIINNYPTSQLIQQGLRAQALALGFPFATNLHKLSAALARIDFSDFIQHHTLVPFLKLQNKQSYLERGRWHSSPWNYHRDIVSLSAGRLKSCVRCADEDRQLRGFSYTRRDHQIPDVKWCLVHGVVLSTPTAAQPQPASGSAMELKQMKHRVFEILCAVYEEVHP